MRVRDRQHQPTIAMDTKLSDLRRGKAVEILGERKFGKVEQVT